ncbi:replication/maintenance protein RepL [uncultured Dysosmobacter sp.]|uniref:replication/maintenance protein RepL n=1 Tax=uncultured Dysosmobacter sp. TaxID=2591384 RepID=UPI00262907E7|nr:replication/maintenance protein RepL [uncultured Dysosmobacter sp.]
MSKTGNSKRLKMRTYTVDENGEVRDSYETYQYVAPIDQYVKQFISPGYAGLKDVSMTMGYELIRRMSFADKGQLVELNAIARKEIAEAVGCSERTVSYQIKILVECGFLRKRQRGIYQVNPFAYGKGTQADIEALRKKYTEEQSEKDGSS